MITWIEGMAFSALVMLCVYAIEPSAPMWLLSTIGAMGSIVGVGWFYNQEH